MDAKKPLSIILSLVLACNTTVLALAEENPTDVGDTSSAIVETKSGKENTGSNGVENEEIGDVAGSATWNETNTANPDADNHENGESSENNKGDAASDNAGGVQDNKGNTADTPSENTPAGSTEPDVPSAKPSATPEPPTEGPAPVEQPVAPAEKEPVITYEKNPDLPEIARYTTADDEGNIEIPEEGLIDFRFPEMVGETTLNTIAAESFMGCQYFKTVTIPAGITSIGDNAFADCQNLQCIILEGRSDAEDLTLGNNWAGDATVLFEEVAVEQPVEEELPPTNENASQPSDTTNDVNAPADNVGGNQTEEPKKDIENASSDASKETENTENTGTAGNEDKTNSGASDTNVNEGTTDGKSDAATNENSADVHKNSDTAYVPKHEDADLPKQADNSGADDAEQE